MALGKKTGGRKPGSANVKTRAIADRAAAEGITPLEVMLRAMREQVAHADALKEQAEEADTALLVGTEGVDPNLPRELRQKARMALNDAAAVAKDAAPYMHPRLAQVQSTVDGNVQATVRIVSEFPDED